MIAIEENRGFRAAPRLFRLRLDSSFVAQLEDACLEIARYANQDLDKVETWTFPVLFRRYKALARVVEKETGKKD